MQGKTGQYVRGKQEDGNTEVWQICLKSRHQVQGSEFQLWGVSDHPESIAVINQTLPARKLGLET